jgi:hypothetical protein
VSSSDFANVIAPPEREKALSVAIELASSISMPDKSDALSLALNSSICCTGVARREVIRLFPVTLTRLGGELTAGRFRTDRRGAGGGENVDIQVVVPAFFQSSVQRLSKQR